MNTKTFIYITLTIIFFACKNTDNPVLVEVGAHKIHQSELKSEFKHYSAFYAMQGKEINNVEMFEKWLNEYIDKALIINKAGALGYDKNNTEIQDAFLVFKKRFLLQEHGPYYNETIVNPITVSDEEQKEAVDKIPYEYTFEVLKFADRAQINAILGNDTLLNNYDDFVRLKNKAAKHYIISQLVKSYWPFQEYSGLHEVLTGMGPGMVTPQPIKAFDTPYKDACFIIYLKNKSLSEFNNDFSLSKESTISIIKGYKEKIAYYSKLRSIFHKSAYKIDNAIVDSLYINITYNKVSLKIDTTNLKSILDSQILTYEINNQSINVSVSDFLDYYNNWPLRYSIKNKHDLYEFVQDIVIADYLWQEAEQSGYTQSEFFVSGEQRHLDEIIIQAYFDNELFSAINITDNDLKDYYQANIQQFEHSEFATIIPVTFESNENIFKAQKLLKNASPNNIYTLLNDTLLKKGWIAMSEPKEIRFDSKDYPEYVVRELFKIDTGTLTSEFAINKNQIMLLKTKEKGEYVIPFNEVKEKIFKSLLYAKQRQLHINLIKNLRSEINIINKVDYNDFVQVDSNTNIYSMSKVKYGS